MNLYGLKNCDTCRKALKSLPGAVFVDVRAQGVPPEIMARALERFGKEIVNTRSTTWRQLGENDRARAPQELLTTYPALMKRPLIVADDGMWLGWTAETRSALGVG